MPSRTIIGNGMLIAAQVAMSYTICVFRHFMFRLDMYIFSEILAKKHIWNFICITSIICVGLHVLYRGYSTVTVRTYNLKYVGIS